MTTKYTLFTDQIGEGKPEDFDPRFTFNAKNQKDANDKAYNWSRYQGLLPREVVAKPTTGNQLDWNTHDEFMN